MFQSIGWPELLVIGLLALLLFGKRLPEVGKSLGKGIVEFKKGLKGIGDELDEAERTSTKQQTTGQGNQLPSSGVARPPLGGSGSAADEDVRVSRSTPMEEPR